MHTSDEYDEDWSDDDYPEDDDDSEDDENQTIECPECGAEIYDDIDVCPICGHAIIHSTNPWQGKSLWWIVLGFLGIIATVVALSVLPI